LIKGASNIGKPNKDELAAVLDLLEEIHYTAEKLDGITKMLLALLDHLKEKNKRGD